MTEDDKSKWEMRLIPETVVFVRKVAEEGETYRVDGDAHFAPAGSYFVYVNGELFNVGERSIKTIFKGCDFKL